MRTARRLVLVALVAMTPVARAQTVAARAPQTPAATPTPAAASAPPESAALAPAAPRDPGLPPGESDAKAQLERSPRHGEFVDVALASGGKLTAWVAYPERKDKAGVVLVIHEIYGVTDWLRGVADQLAKEGFIAVVPDLISGLGPNGAGSLGAASRDEVVQLIRGLKPEETTARLAAVRAFAEKIPAGNGKLATLGFCWGGGRSFAYAAAEPTLAGAVVYYGSSPEAADLANIKAPVLGLYGGDDARITATLDATKAEMKLLGKPYDVHIFDGAGHGFLRAQGDREGANRRATKEAWELTLAFLRRQLGR